MADFPDVTRDDWTLAVSMHVLAERVYYFDQPGVNYWWIHEGYPSPPIVTMYKMRGQDAVVNGLYDTWLTTGAPDTDASDYHGPLATPLRDVIVIDQWTA